MVFENKVELGNGIYTLSDMASILNLKYHKVSRLLSEYWDKEFAIELGDKYSWTVGKSKAVSFHTLVEFYIFYQFRNSGVSTKKIKSAHQELATMYNTPFPFANSNILAGIHCVGKKIIFEIKENQIIDLDSSKQLNLKFIKNFVKKLDFDKSNLAKRLYPLGKNNSVIVDPENQFGQPTISGTNLFPETIFNLYINKEPKDFISKTFGISIKEVSDAIEYCQKHAA